MISRTFRRAIKAVSIRLRRRRCTGAPTGTNGLVNGISRGDRSKIPVQSSERDSRPNESCLWQGCSRPENKQISKLASLTPCDHARVWPSALSWFGLGLCAVLPGDGSRANVRFAPKAVALSLIHISEPTRQAEISYAVFCL